MRFEKLLGFCAAVKDGQLCEYDENGLALFAHLRIQGYVAALKTNSVQQVVLFGPQRETDVITRMMSDGGVSPERIACFETNVTTLGNAAVMRQYLDCQNIEPTRVIGSTSHYHLPRAQLMGELLHAFGITWIAAEAFLFAPCGCHTTMRAVQQKLQAEFGDGPLTQRIVSEIKGQWDLAAGVYKSKKVSEQGPQDES